MAMRLVLIEWIDSHSGRGWRSLDEMKDSAEYLRCRSVGWLLISNSKVVVIVPHVYDEQDGKIVMQGCGEMTIPKRAILTMRSLGVGRKEER